MPQLIHLTTKSDARGSLTVIEKDLGFPIERVFYIYDACEKRGGHGHKKTQMALIALGGHVVVAGQSPSADFHFELSSPSEALLLGPEDWHEMTFSPGAILLVLASTAYSPDDYFFEKYRKSESPK